MPRFGTAWHLHIFISPSLQFRFILHVPPLLGQKGDPTFGRTPRRSTRGCPNRPRIESIDLGSNRASLEMEDIGGRARKKGGGGLNGFWIYAVLIHPASTVLRGVHFRDMMSVLQSLCRCLRRRFVWVTSFCHRVPCYLMLFWPPAKRATVLQVLIVLRFGERHEKQQVCWDCTGIPAWSHQRRRYGGFSKRRTRHDGPSIADLTWNKPVVTHKLDTPRLYHTHMFPSFQFPHPSALMALFHQLKCPFHGKSMECL